jgi:predicted transposase YbfD/YdcC
MVSAYATEARLVLGQQKVCDKRNEITAIPKLLEWLDLKGATVTIDALGCQVEIANQILGKEGLYILALKGNHKTPCSDVEEYFQDPLLRGSLEAFEEFDKGHGHLEGRKCWVLTEVAWLKERHPQWQSLQSLLCIQATREIKRKATTETRYYIASAPPNA